MSKRNGNSAKTADRTAGRNWFARARDAWGRRRRGGEPSAPLSLRRWDAARTDRLNKGHWQPVTGGTINADLVSQLETLRTRSEFEAANNSMVEGMINTHLIDTVGKDGPSLQVESDSAAYNEALEELWHKWWAAPDLNGRLSGVELLQLWVRSLWTAGEYLVQIVSDPESPGPVKMRLRNLHPRRLATSPALIGDADVLLGVRRNKTGRPTKYVIDKTNESALAGAFGLEHKEIPAAEIIHEFIALEADQVRGVPWLSSVLGSIAELRDYDAHVLEAARQAASFGVLLSTNSDQAPFTMVNESAEIERGMMTTLPPGYIGTQISPQQPSTNYVEYRRERLRDLGRPVGMPLMTVALDSRKHNYSSARFDGQVYQRSIARLQGQFARRVLQRLVDMVAAEAVLAGALPARPDNVRYHWTWPVPPHVDPLKEAKAATERLRNGTSNPMDECAALARDWEENVAKRRRALEDLTAAGLSAGIDEPTEEETSEEKAEEKAEEVAAD